jgi:hypothetical protein
MDQKLNMVIVAPSASRERKRPGNAESEQGQRPPSLWSSIAARYSSPLLQIDYTCPGGLVRGRFSHSTKQELL